MKRLLWLSLLALPAFAQESAQQAPAEAAPMIEVAPLKPEAQLEAPDGQQEQPARLDDVVVTATKRATSVREIPSTVTALSGEDLEREGVQSIDQIVAQVPGVNLSDTGTGETKRIAIRGVSTDLNVSFTAGTLFGDIPFSDTFIPKVQLDPNPFDMATVEVLKGPQGTLFGGSGLNGMIRYVPEAPRFGEFQVKYFTQYNSYTDDGGDGWSYGAALNTPLGGDTAALRLMAFRRDSPGFVDDTQSGKPDVNSTSQYGWRAMLGWLPGENWKLSLMLTGQHTLQDDVGFTANREGRLERGNTPRPSPAITDYKLANLGVEYAFSWADVISQTSVFDKQYDANLDTSRLVPGGQVPIFSLVNTNESKALVQEFRLVSADDPGSPWKWLAGVYYYRSQLFDCTDGPLELPGPAALGILPGLLVQPCSENAEHAGGKLGIIHLEGDLELTEKAVFGEVTRKLSERSEVTLGARFYQTGSEGEVITAGALYAPQTLGRYIRRRGDVQEDGVSPKLSLSIHTADNVLNYFTVSRGFRFGGIQLNTSTPLSDVPEQYKSDSLWNYELGLRSEWFDRTLFLDASAYAIDWTDPQVFQQTADGLGTYIDNVGGVKGKGIEMSTRWLLPWPAGLSLGASGAWNDTRTTEGFDSSSGQFVPAGSPWPLSPRWQTTASLAYALPLQDWRAAASLRRTYSSTACNVIECNARVFGYRTIDLNLSLASLTWAWAPELSVTLGNLTNERGISSATVNPTLGDTTSYIAPRALTVRLSGSF